MRSGQMKPLTTELILNTISKMQKIHYKELLQYVRLQKPEMVWLRGFPQLYSSLDIKRNTHSQSPHSKS